MCQLTNMGAYEVFSKNNNNNNSLLLIRHKIAFKYNLMHNLGLVVTVINKTFSKLIVNRSPTC